MAKSCGIASKKPHYGLIGFFLGVFADAIILLFLFLPHPMGENFWLQLAFANEVIFCVLMTILPFISGFLGYLMKHFAVKDKQLNENEDPAAYTEKDYLLRKLDEPNLGIHIQDGIVYLNVKSIPLSEASEYIGQLLDMYKSVLNPIYQDKVSIVADYMMPEKMVADYYSFVSIYNYDRKKVDSSFSALNMTYAEYLAAFKDKLQKKYGQQYAKLKPEIENLEASREAQIFEGNSY